ncbi:MAG: hypothetical protein ACYCPF_13335 [Streptosporangiaceae bacterium]
MAGTPLGGPPGTAGGSAGFPQWGVDQAGHIVKAADQAEKIRDIDAGYMEWFTSRQAAANAWAGQQGFLGNGGGTLASPFGFHWPSFQHLRGFVVRALKVTIGIGLIFLGLTQLSHVSSILPKAAKGLVLEAAA